MTRRWILVGLLSIALGASSRSFAQTSDGSTDDSGSTASSTASAAGVPTTTSGATQQAPTLIGLIAKIPACLKACKKKCCKSCVGVLLTNILKPITLATGGCITCCPVIPDAEDLAQAGAGGACAQILKDSLEAPERIQTVRCLAMADCAYWPEAEKGLIDLLRADKNESVRLEAAFAIGTGCCCTAKMMEALRLTATGGTSDGNPAESSMRVRQVAAHSLTLCQSRCADKALSIPPERPVPPERPSKPGTPAPLLPPPGAANSVSRSAASLGDTAWALSSVSKLPVRPESPVFTETPAVASAAISAVPEDEWNSPAAPSPDPIRASAIRTSAEASRRGERGLLQIFRSSRKPVVVDAPINTGETQGGSVDLDESPRPPSGGFEPSTSTERGRGWRLFRSRG